MTPKFLKHFFQVSTNQLSILERVFFPPQQGIMTWKGVWSPGRYEKNDVVRDNTWLSIALEDTEERSAPQPSGPVDELLPDTPTWDATQQQAAVVYSGQDLIFTKGGWVKQIEIWAPELTSNTNYRTIIEDTTDPENPIRWVIEEPVLFEDAWTSVFIGERIVLAGTKWRVYVDALDSNSTTNISGGWRQDVPSQNAEPLTGGWNRNNSNDVVRIDKTDLDTDDRSTELLSATVDSIIRFVQTSDSTRSRSYRVNDIPVNAGTYVLYTVDNLEIGIGGEPLVGEPCTTDIDVPIPTNTKYKQLTDQYLTQPDFATVAGFLQFDGVDQSGVVDNAYSINIDFQEAYISPDWEVMSNASF